MKSIEIGKKYKLEENIIKITNFKNDYYYYEIIKKVNNLSKGSENNGNSFSSNSGYSYKLELIKTKENYQIF